MKVPGFQILRRIGKGGMGDVFHAVRVGPGGFRKPVALKRLQLDHSIDARMVQRFFAEARISAQLEHENVVRVHDLLVVDDGHFIVMELLRGRNLAAARTELVAAGPLPWWLPFAIAEQALAGLEYAHALRDEHGRPLGLVHRDLTPRNLFVCEGGVVKILDFGIAKLRHALTAPLTRDGSLHGTLEFLAPEQARGEPVDARTDLYQLAGSIYWTLTGEFPHGSGTAAEIVARVLAGTVRPLRELRGDVPERAAQVIARAMASAPEERYADATEMRDAVAEVLRVVDGAGADVIAAALSSLPPAPEEPELPEEAAPEASATPAERPRASDAGALAPTVSAARGREQAEGAPGGRRAKILVRRVVLGASTLAAIAAVGVAAFLAGRCSAPGGEAAALAVDGGVRQGAAATPSYRRLTFRRGSVFSGRFAPDGKFVYSAAWGDEDTETFVGVAGKPEARTLRLPGTEIRAVGRGGAILLLNDVQSIGYERRGVLASSSIESGEAPRDLLEDVSWADYGPKGEIVVARAVAGRARIEAPVGAVIHEAQTLAWIGEMRVSPDGRRVAFLDHPMEGDDAGYVAVIDRETRAVTRLSARHGSVQGLAWAPSGEEILFTAGSPRALRAITLDGRERVIDETPGGLTLLDVAPDGRILVRRDVAEVRTIADSKGKPARDVSWFHWSFAGDISDDGKSILIVEGGVESNPDYGTYLRPIDGSGPAVKVTDGIAGVFTHDGKWVLSMPLTRDVLTLTPTRTGEPRVLIDKTLGRIASAGWLPGEQQLFLFAARAGEEMGAYVYDLARKEARLVRAKLGYVAGRMVAPDGTSALARDAETQRLVRVWLDDGRIEAIPGVRPGEDFATFAADGRSIWIATLNDAPVRVEQLDLATGARRFWRKVMPDDPTGVQSITVLAIAPSGEAWAYSYYRNLSTLYLVEGAR